MTYVRTFLFLTAVSVTLGLPAERHRGARSLAIPPTPRNKGHFAENHDHEKIATQIKSWKPSDPQNVWELSGLYEGDIMLEPSTKNGILDTQLRWPGAIVPYYIEEKDFDEDEIEVIKKAINEYHEKTCVRFRPYTKFDLDYVRIQSKSSGCWSMVGRHGKGQEVNLQKGGCVRHGVVVHELLHALGFFHQQSAANRDEWVKIHWENIKLGKESNFAKYDNDTVTDYGYPYDYSSIMHYSAYAFSSNGEETITAKVKDAKIGQRKGLSSLDIGKLQAMYKGECESRLPEGNKDSDSSEDISFTWILENLASKNQQTR